MKDLFYTPYEQISVGEAACKTICLTDELVSSFCGVYNDTSSFHVNDELAAMTVYGKRICHGIHLAGYFAEVMGKQLPGFGTVYCSQTLNFYQPVYIGETVTITLTVLEKLNGHKLRLSTVITNTENHVVIAGEAVVKTYK